MHRFLEDGHDDVILTIKIKKISLDIEGDSENDGDEDQSKILIFCAIFTI
jgi:hypothetical protein